MKILVLIALCGQLAASVSLAPFSGRSNRLVGQIAGIQSPHYDVIDLRIRFFTQRRGGTPLAEQIYPQVELVRGRFSVRLDPMPDDESRFVEIGLRPAGRRYALFTPLLPRRRLQAADRSVARVWRRGRESRMPHPVIFLQRQGDRNT